MNELVMKISNRQTANENNLLQPRTSWSPSEFTNIEYKWLIWCEWKFNLENVTSEIDATHEREDVVDLQLHGDVTDVTASVIKLLNLPWIYFLFCLSAKSNQQTNNNRRTQLGCYITHKHKAAKWFQ